MYLCFRGHFTHTGNINTLQKLVDNVEFMDHNSMLRIRIRRNKLSVHLIYLLTKKNQLVVNIEKSKLPNGLYDVASINEITVHRPLR